jgi:glutamyl-tRNA synthetase
MSKIKVRFAPSPTGEPHLGSIRTALFNWLFAKKNKGKFILRIEDTDRERYNPESEKAILESLKWLGLDWDEGPIRQSERLKIYQEYAGKLVKNKKAYYCFCTEERLNELRENQKANRQVPKYDKKCLSLKKEELEGKIKEKMPHVIRMNIPDEGSVEFEDIIRGKVRFENKNLDDQILLKSDGFPTYHLACVVDDHEMKISHVIRAEEWLPSTPKHVLLYKAFGWSMPKFAHLPLILGSDKSKLAKRHGAVSVLEYKEKGYLPEALLNFLAFLGWNPKTEKEIYTVQELIDEFDLKKVNKAGAVFNIEKLNWLNALYLRKLDAKKLTESCFSRYQRLTDSKNPTDFVTSLDSVSKAIQDRLVILDDVLNLADFFFKELDYNKELLIPKDSDSKKTLEFLERAKSQINEIPENEFKSSALKKIFLELCQKEKIKTNDILWPLRVALSFKKASPDVFDIMEALGKERVIKRIDKAIKKL